MRSRYQSNEASTFNLPLSDLTANPQCTQQQQQQDESRHSSDRDRHRCGDNVSAPLFQSDESWRASRGNEEDVRRLSGKKHKRKKKKRARRRVKHRISGPAGELLLMTGNDGGSHKKKSVVISSQTHSDHAPPQNLSSVAGRAVMPVSSFVDCDVVSQTQMTLEDEDEGEHVRNRRRFQSQYDPNSGVDGFLQLSPAWTACCISLERYVDFPPFSNHGGNWMLCSSEGTEEELKLREEVVRGCLPQEYTSIAAVLAGKHDMFVSPQLLVVYIYSVQCHTHCDWTCELRDETGLMIKGWVEGKFVRDRPEGIRPGVVLLLKNCSLAVFPGIDGIGMAPRERQKDPSRLNQEPTETDERQVDRMLLIGEKSVVYVWLPDEEEYITLEEKQNLIKGRFKTRKRVASESDSNEMSQVDARLHKYVRLHSINDPIATEKEVSFDVSHNTEKMVSMKDVSQKAVGRMCINENKEQDNIHSEELQKSVKYNLEKKTQYFDEEKSNQRQNRGSIDKDVGSTNEYLHAKKKTKIANRFQNNEDIIQRSKISSRNDLTVSSLLPPHEGSTDCTSVKKLKFGPISGDNHLVKNSIARMNESLSSCRSFICETSNNLSRNQVMNNMKNPCEYSSLLGFDESLPSSKNSKGLSHFPMDTPEPFKLDTAVTRSLNLRTTVRQEAKSNIFDTSKKSVDSIFANSNLSTMLSEFDDDDDYE